MKLLLLHPLPLDGSVYSDDLRDLTDECAAPTLYGEGDDIVEWARAALDAVGDGDVVVVGTSIGGSCAIEVARLAPLKVKALVLCGTKPRPRPEPAFRDEAVRVLEQDGVDVAWARYWRPLFGPNASAAILEQARLTSCELGAEALASGVVAFHNRPDGEGFLRTWPGRVTLVHGEHDTAPKPDRALADRVPRATFRRAAGIGHYVPLEAPAVLRAITCDAIEAAGSSGGALQRDHFAGPCPRDAS